MPKVPQKPIESFFERIGDHRSHNKLHKLIDVILIATTAAIAGRILITSF